ncbi:MAG: glycosyltransferase family 10 [bacterium]|nr:glycosyltransferase family 10 [bacterium]
MAKKVIINIVYSPQTGPAHKAFENEKGIIWRSSKYDQYKINVGMGWYSIPKPKPRDSIWVVEPYCILERDYDYRFVNTFKHIFTWAPQAFSHKQLQPKIVETNHPTYHKFSDPDRLIQSWPEWNKRKNEIIFIANNKTSKHHSELYSLRLQLADMLHAKSKFKVSWYGQIPINRPYFKGPAKSKQELVKNVKFSICTENSYDPVYTHGYFTEKMPDVWVAGTVPIYMGCHNIDSFKFPEQSYIDLRTYVKKENGKFNINEQALINRIENFSEEQYKNYLNSVKNQILMPQKLKDTSSFEAAYKIIINTFYNEMLTRK